MKITPIAGKMLVALDRETKKEIGSAYRVAIVGEKNAQKVWLVELRGRLVGVKNTWDECSTFLREKGCIVRIHEYDPDTLDDDMTQGPNSLTSRAPIANRAAS